MNKMWDYFSICPKSASFLDFMNKQINEIMLKLNLSFLLSKNGFFNSQFFWDFFFDDMEDEIRSQTTVFFCSSPSKLVCFHLQCFSSYFIFQICAENLNLSNIHVVKLLKTTFSRQFL